jgi:hypothetical protein
MVSRKRTLDDGEMLTDLDKILYHLWLISNLESRPLALVIVGANITENFKTMKCSKITYYWMPITDYVTHGEIEQ